MTFKDGLAALALRWAPKGAFGRTVGWLTRRYIPRPLRLSIYGGFARSVGIDLSLVDRPLDAFERFDEFFARPLRPDARPLANAKVVNPVDGTVSAVGTAEGGRLIQCKGLDYTLAGLLADANWARKFDGGKYATLYLAPYNYHRIHSPVDGEILGFRHIPGAFFPVNPLSVRTVQSLFAINERVVTYIRSPQVGDVAVVKVAATGVGNITLAYEPRVRTHRRGRTGRRGWQEIYAQPRPIERGVELGAFHLGSTVIVLFEKGRVRLDLEPGQHIEMGGAMAVVLGKSGEVAA
jgi:phosphatidylserine decarboxylase